MPLITTPLAPLARRYLRSVELDARLHDMLARRAVPSGVTRPTISSARAAHATFARWLLWRLWLAHTRPTLPSLLRCLRRLIEAAKRLQPKTQPQRDDGAGGTNAEDWGETSPDDLDMESLTDLDALDLASLGGLSAEQIAALAAAAQNLDTAAFVEAGAALDLDIGGLGVDLGGTISTLTLLRLVEGMWTATAALDELHGQFAALGALGAAGVGLVGGDFAVIDPLFYSYLRTQAGGLITGIDATTRTQIAQLLWQLAGAGSTTSGFTPFSTPAMVSYLRGLWYSLGNDLSLMSPYRAFMIASTEMARAQTFGAMASYWAMGVQRKQWQATAGACMLCLTNQDEGPIALDAWFPTGDIAPPAHPFCRCNIQPVLATTFDPAAWVARDPAAWEGMLADSSYQNWPDVGIPGSPPPPEQPIRVRLVGHAGKLRPHLRLTPGLDALAAQLVGEIEQLADGWASAAGVPMPRDIHALRRLVRGLDSLTPQVAMADAACWDGFRARAAQLSSAVLKD